MGELKTPKMGRSTRLELATSRFTVWRSNQLNYDRRVFAREVYAKRVEWQKKVLSFCPSSSSLYNICMLLTKELLHTTDAHIKKLKAAGIETT